MNLNFYAIQKTVKALAENAGLTVVFENDKDQPRTDGKTIYLPTPDPNWTADELLLWEYKCYHEIGHERPKTRDWLNCVKKHKIQGGSFESFVNNALDDFRQEYIDHDLYIGRQNVMSKGRAMFMSKNSANIGKDSVNKLRQAAESLWVWDAFCRKDWMRDVADLYKDLEEDLTAQSKDWYNILSKDYTERLKKCETAEDVYNLSAEIMEKVFKIPEEEAKKSKESSSDSGDGDEGDESGDKESDSAKSKEGKSKSKKKTVSYEDLLMHKHDAKGSSYTELNTRIEYVTYKGRREYIPYNIDEIKIYDYASGAKVPSYTNSRITEVDINSSISNTVRKLLQVLSISKHQHDQKSGKIDAKNIYRVTMADAKGYNERVFKRKMDTITLKDNAVTILTDFSGSMNNKKIVEASRASVILADTLQKLNIPVEVLGFTEQRPKLIMNIFKTFAQRIESSMLLSYFSDASQRMIQNADGDSIMFAYNRLKSRKENRKILIVMSDGSPSADRPGDIYGYTKEVVNAIQKSPSGVEIYGIGIMDENVKNFYKENVVIDSADKLEEALLTVIKNKLIGVK